MSTIVIEVLDLDDGGGLSYADADVEDAHEGVETLEGSFQQSDFITVDNSLFAGLYYATEAFVEFDLSGVLGPATEAVLRLVGKTFANATDDQVVEMYAFDFGSEVDTADFRPKSWLAAATPLATLAVPVSLSTEEYVEFVANGSELLDAINAAHPGPLRVVFALASHRLGVTPTDTNFIQFYLTDADSAPPAQLVIDYGELSLAGNQPAATGAIAGLLDLSLAGNQPSATGSVTATFVYRARSDLALPRGSARSTLPRPVRGSISTSRDGTL